MGEAKRKLAREASDDENSIPGTHGPVSDRSARIMRGTMETLRKVWPEAQFVMFVFEPGPPGSMHHGRYNYASTAERADVVAVLRSFLARQEEMERIDQAIAEPAKGSA